MAITDQTVSLSAAQLERIQDELRSRELPSWLLYGFHNANPVASGLLGLPALTRRYFVLIPRDGEPVALTHRIEQQPWRGWIGERRIYSGWRELERELGEMLRGRQQVAMEYAADDAVPYVDHLPAGVADLVRSTGVEVVSSGDLVSAFYSRWSAEGEASHRRASEIVRDVAHAAFRHVGERLGAGESVDEWGLRQWIQEELHGRGLRVGGDCIVAIGPNAANPHYAPGPESHAPVATGDLLLIDLWGKEDEEAVYADQTWMGYVGEVVPDRLQGIWEAVRDARDAAVEHIRTAAAAGQPVRGYEADDAARALIRERGYGDAFIHRTGHSIDRELHGSGPNIDNLETRDTRELIQGVGFSVEPGIYLPSDVGFRTEINVLMTADGPEITTPEPQRDIILIP